MTPKYSATVDGKLYYTNESGRGVFTERADGTDHQHVGTNDAPPFHSEEQLKAWIGENLDTDD